MYLRVYREEPLGIELEDLTPIEHENTIMVQNSLQTVSDSDHDCAAEFVAKGTLNLVKYLTIHICPPWVK